MMTIRRRYEDVFIPRLTDADNIPVNDYFDFNCRRVVNSSDTKRMTVWKIKAYPKNLTAEVGLAIDGVKGTQQHKQIHYALIDNQSAIDLLIPIVSEINKCIDLLYPDIFPSAVSYSWTVITIVNQQWLLLPYCCLNLILPLFFKMHLWIYSISSKTTRS
jgi:hypothetical protein